ncbi:MAG TPA: penicillin acylase family protein [Thermoleophilaceae bacterium]|nr:penicillin acylase family protein [Thermoleophilaceae bacterium]
MVAGALLLPGAAGARVRQAEDILPPGQSGFVSVTGLADGTGSPHLQDQTPLFLRHRFKGHMFGQPAESTESPRSGVTIARDRFGVPSVRGNTADDVWFGAGYSMAQDRLFQLELFRRATKGHLAEILGKGYVEMDVQVRRDFYNAAERAAQLASLPPALRARFVSMRDGINAWIAETRLDPTKRPGEFAAVGEPTGPADWTLDDSTAIGIYLARTVPSDDGEELNNVRALRAFGAPLFDRLLPIRAKHQLSTVPRSAGSFPAQPGRTRKQERTGYARSQKFTASLALPSAAAAGGGSAAAKERRLPLIGALGHHGGSNMWALRGGGGTATLWNGPQLGFQIPELFVELELHGPGIDVRGTTAPGVPVIGIGHNGHVAWGLTSGLTDDDDLYAEKLAGPEAYTFKGKRVKMNCHTETVEYNSPPSDILGMHPPESGSQDVRLCRTVHGPVQERAGGVAYARRYAIWKREVGTLRGLSEVNAARTIGDVNRAAAKLTWNENLMAADDRGHIGYWHPGLLQIKPRGWDERLPFPGTGNAEWRGFLTVAQRPRVIDPKQGYLFNWNNMPSTGWTQGDAPARERLLGPHHRSGLIRKAVKRAKRRGGGFVRTRAVDAYTGYHAQQRVLLDKRLRHVSEGARGKARAVLKTILRWQGNYARTDAKGRVAPGVAAWRTFMAEAQKRMFGRFTGEGVESVLDTRGGSHLLESTWGEVYALRHLPRRTLRAVAAKSFGILVGRFGTANRARWREPRQMYETSSQGAASMGDIPFFDRGTYEHVVELGP